MSKKESDAEPKNDGKSGLVYTLVATFVTGAIGFIFQVANDVRNTELAFVNAQIEKLYGPLYAGTQANSATWNLYCNTFGKKANATTREECFIFDGDRPSAVEDVKRWRHWVKTVFQEQNKKMETVINSSAHLLIGNTVPRVFRDFIAHTEAYNAVISTWADGDLELASGLTRSVNTAIGYNYPKLLDKCIAADYYSLKKYQTDLEHSLFEAFLSHPIVRSPYCDADEEGGSVHR